MKMWKQSLKAGMVGLALTLSFVGCSETPTAVPPAQTDPQPQGPPPGGQSEPEPTPEETTATPESVPPATPE